MKLTITFDIEPEEFMELFGDESEEDIWETEDVKYGSSIYARFFDEGCAGWDKDSRNNTMFLLMHQDWANDLLRARGHVLLNDIFDALGFPRTKEGAIAGWVYDEEHPERSRIDFGLDKPHNEWFMEGKTACPLLVFNVMTDDVFKD